jgi:hypothetical protein
MKKSLSNISSVSLVMAMIFLGLIALMFFRTCRRMTTKSQTQRQKIWKVFYWIVWVNVIITDALFWTVGIELITIDITGLNNNFFQLAGLIFLPAVLQTLIYGGIYWAMEKSISEGKVRVGAGFRSRFRSDRCA